MLEQFIPIIAILSAVALPITLGVYFGLRTNKLKHIERMEMIKQGMIPPENDKGVPNKLKTLRSGIVLVGIALGLITGLIISKSLNLNEDNAFWAVAPSVLFFFGLSYLIYFNISNKMKETGNDE